MAAHRDDEPARASGREERRRQILTKARDVFALKGYHATKIEDIVVSAGVARGTFYLYFHDKKSIFEELVNGFFHAIGAAVHRIDTDLPIDPQVRGNVKRLVSLCLSDPLMTKVLLADAMGLDAEFDRRLLAFYADIVELLQTSLREGQELGIVQPGDVRVAAHFTLGGVKEVLLQFVRAPIPADAEAVCEGIHAFLRCGILIAPQSSQAAVRAEQTPA